MKSEIKIILELCQWMNNNEKDLSEILKEDIDYPWILGQILYNRVGGQAYYSLYKMDLVNSLNREFRNSLRTVYETNKIKTNSFKRALDYLSIIFSKADFNYSLLKGAYLADIYPEGLRTSNDIDILISNNDITKLCDLLKSYGFIQGKHIFGKGIIPADRKEILLSRLNRGETVPFIKTINYPMMEVIEIDVNFSLDYKAKQSQNTVEQLLNKSKPMIKTNNGNLYTLSHEDFLIHLCAHLFKEATTYQWVKMGRDLSLYKFNDIYTFLNLFLDKDFLAKVVNRIKKLNLEKECYYAFHNTFLLFPKTNTLIEQLQESIKPKKLLYLNHIVSPQENIILEYDMDFIKWVFNKNRNRCLLKNTENGV